MRDELLREALDIIRLVNISYPKMYASLERRITAFLAGEVEQNAAVRTPCSPCPSSPGLSASSDSTNGVSHTSGAASLDERESAIQSAPAAPAPPPAAGEGTTHAEGCWTWGPRHYQCAVAHALSAMRELATLKEWSAQQIGSLARARSEGKVEGLESAAKELEQRGNIYVEKWGKLELDEHAKTYAWDCLQHAIAIRSLANKLKEGA